MEKLFEKFHNRLKTTDLRFTRTIMDKIRWEARLIGIKGARGVGKTTLLLQYIKKWYESDPSVLYVSLDDIWFSGNSLSDLTDRFVKQGGKLLVIDEIHKYNNWSREIKNIYDSYPELRIIFTGSSLLEISEGEADLSRRVIMYNMQGLSFREYLDFETGIKLKPYSLDDVLTRQIGISNDVLAVIRPLQHFPKYIREGYYPFFKEVPDLYYIRLGEVINTIIETELPQLRNFNVVNSSRIKHMLLAIAEEAPFIPNITKLSKLINVDRNTFLTYLRFLGDAALIRNVYADSIGISRMQKPEKIFLENTNIPYAMGCMRPSADNIYTTFIANQLSAGHKLTIHDSGDLMIDGEIRIVVDSQKKPVKTKSDTQYFAQENLEYGYGNTIPVWMFGLLY